MSTLSVVLLVSLCVCGAALVATGSRLVTARRRVRILRAQLDGTRRTARQTAVLGLKTVVGTAVRMREQGVGGFLTSSIEELTGIALADRTEIVKVAAPDGTVVVLFSDIEDSTALNERLGDETWVRLLGAHDAVVRRHVDRHHGHIVKSQGDGFMVVFGDAADAVAAATEIQRSLAGGVRRVLRRTPIRVRMGVHVGAAIERDGDYFGRNVAMAARVAGQAEGGQILVSEPTHDSLADDVAFVGEAVVAELKGFPGQHRLWEVDWA